MEKGRKRGLTIIKIAVSLLLVYFVFTKVDFQEVWGILRKSTPAYLLLTLFFFVASKVVAAFRLNLYFHRIEVPLSHSNNLKLYLLGMFYNLFLPGGIGGDAYKGYFIRKRFQVETKRIVAVLLLDRFSGLLLLFVYGCILAVSVEHPFLENYRFVFIAGGPITVLIFWMLNRRFFRFAFPVFWKSLLFSAVVQGLQLLSLYGILLALGVEIQRLTYLFVFLISSIVSVVPLTIGGVGSRELTFYYGAQWLNLNENTSIGISVAFFLITAVVSFLGIYYHFKKPVVDSI